MGARTCSPLGRATHRHCVSLLIIGRQRSQLEWGMHAGEALREQRELRTGGTAQCSGCKPQVSARESR